MRTPIFSNITSLKAAAPVTLMTYDKAILFALNKKTPLFEGEPPVLVSELTDEATEEETSKVNKAVAFSVIKNTEWNNKVNKRRAKNRLAQASRRANRSK